MRWLALLALLAGCGGKKASARLDPARLPPQARGLIPGLSTEADVTKVAPGAVITRDKTLGGPATLEVEVGDALPGVRILDEPARFEAWFTKVDGELRVSSLRMHVDDHCAEALQILSYAVEGTCRKTNRRYKKEEHQLCAATPDGKHMIGIECLEHGGELSMWLTAVGRSYRVYDPDYLQR